MYQVVGGDEAIQRHRHDGAAGGRRPRQTGGGVKPPDRVGDEQRNRRYGIMTALPSVLDRRGAAANSPAC